MAVVSTNGDINSSGSIYTSADSGATWISNNVPGYHWGAVASSADGNKLIAVARWYAGPIYTSTDSGASWTASSAPSLGWCSVAASADGNKLIAAPSLQGRVYTSQTTPAPQMKITPTNGELELSWIVPSTNFVAQQSADLAGWTDVTNLPVLNLTNLQDEVRLSPAGSSGFYRLKTP